MSDAPNPYHDDSDAGKPVIIATGIVVSLTILATLGVEGIVPIIVIGIGIAALMMFGRVMVATITGRW